MSTAIAMSIISAATARLLLGHGHPKVVEAVHEQIERGTHYGASHETEIAWAEWVLKLVPSAERVRFTSSGTEATLMAVRLPAPSPARPSSSASSIISTAGTTT